jgi:hypothetical protein
LRKSTQNSRNPVVAFDKQYLSQFKALYIPNSFPEQIISVWRKKLW